MPPKPSAHVAVFSLLGAATLWGVFWYPMRLLDQHGVHGLWTSVLLYGGAFLLGLPMIWRHRAEFAPHLRILLGFAVINAWCNAGFVVAVVNGTVVRVLLLFYLSPLWTLLLGQILLKERPGRSGVMVCALAMVGTAIMLWNPELGLPVPRGWPEWLAVSAGFAFAWSNIILRKGQDIPMPVKMATSWVGVAVLALVAAMISGEGVPHATPAIFAAALIFGGAGMFLTTLCLQYGVTHLPAHRAAVILLFELVAGAASAQWLTDEVVRPNEWLGGALILLGAWFAARGQRGT